MSVLSFLPSASARQQTEADALIGVLVRAFAGDPAVRWMYSDDARYETHFLAFARAFGGRAFQCGTALSSANGRGVALWLPPGTGPDELELGRVLEHSVDPEKLPHVGALLEQMGRLHPEEPHWYLPMIGVDPECQSQGVGSELMRRGLQFCDRDGMAAYLESTNPRNIPFYRRLGFEIVGEMQAGDSPVITAMFRPAQK